MVSRLLFASVSRLRFCLILFVHLSEQCFCGLPPLFRRGSKVLPHSQTFITLFILHKLTIRHMLLCGVNGVILPAEHC